ncbi:hypothetical protein AB0A69_09140 [Streptomyces sp. NPDC045431]|uniref:hypothetical protein n=1 Tax=Streptomyces sp. NPDC045431 TaxID=3155613 RepID=UPI0033E08700
MSIPSPIPILRGNRGTELRCEGEDLLLRRSDEELRIPFAAIARVRAERRDVTVELTAPAGAEPTAYRVEDVSAAAAAVFADAVTDVLPERPAGEEPVDGSALVTVRSLRAAADGAADGEGDEEPYEEPPLVGRAALAPGVVLAVLSVTVWVAGGHVGRAIATLLLGSVGAWLGFHACRMLWDAWDSWYLPRYGITVEFTQVILEGEAVFAFTDSSGAVHRVGRNVLWCTTGQAAYHPRNPQRAVAGRGWRGIVPHLALGLFVAALATAVGYGTLALALPAFDG